MSTEKTILIPTMCLTSITMVINQFNEEPSDLGLGLGIDPTSLPARPAGWFYHSIDYTL
jgi:hypothetical protein